MSTENSKFLASQPQNIEGREFDEPLILPGAISREPERYVAEKPFELTRHEYSILRRPFVGSFWVNISVGATAGVAIAVLGKVLTALLTQQQPTLELWEIITFVIGVFISLFFKYFFRSSGDDERKQLLAAVDRHFSQSKPRRVHVTKSETEE